MSNLNDYLQSAQQAAEVIPTVLQQRGLPNVIERFVLAQSPRGTIWLFAVLDVQRIQRLERYTQRDTIHQISTALAGKPVKVSNHNGLRLAVSLSGRPELPSDIPYPGYRTGLLQIGVDWRGAPVELHWSKLPHGMVAGMTRSGKSNFLKLMVAQAVDAGCQLILVDPDGRTFPALAGHPALLAQIAGTPEASELAVERAAQEMTRRSALYGTVGPFVDTLETYNDVSGDAPLPHVLVVLDEFNSLITAAGGPRSSLAGKIVRLAWGGLKFGIHLVVGAQDFSAAIVGPMRDQLGLRLCFGVQKASTSRVVLGHAGAEQIHARGRALTTDWGLVQVYKAPEITPHLAGDGLMQDERRIVDALNADAGGRMTFDALAAMGKSRREAEKLRADWLTRGLAVRGKEDNALLLAPHLYAPRDGLDE